MTGRARMAACLMGLFLLLGGQAVGAEAGQAPVIQPESASIPSGESDPEVLLDGVRSTKWRSQAGKVEVVLPEEASALYLEWDFAPATWTLQADGEERTVGREQFIHAYLPLEEPASRFTLSWEGDATLCDLYFLGEGSLPSWVQQWEPPCDKADFLLLPTHADDEHLWFGGVMPLYAGEKDLAVQVAYMVNHNTEPYRLHEQLDGLWTVGVENYPVIPQYPDIYSESLDHARTVYSQEEIIAYQVGLIRRFCPSVIVGHDINGEYGHGAHRLNTDSLLQAVELAADETAYPEFSAPPWDTPKTYLHLYPENAIVMDWDQPLAAFGGKTAFEMAQEGFACHASQTAYFSVDQSGPYDCRKFGLYRSTVGPDTTADMTQNLPEPEPEPSSPPAAESRAEPAQADRPVSSQPEEVPQETEGGGLSPLAAAGVALGGCALLALAAAAVLRR